jgi:hypothetical protein
MDAPAAVEVGERVVVGGADVGLGRPHRDDGVAGLDGQLVRWRSLGGVRHCKDEQAQSSYCQCNRDKQA